MAGTLAIVITLVAVGAVAYYGLQLILAEVFPYWELREQHHNRPTLKTKSYQGRTAIITGANGAFGSRAAKIFAERDVRVLVLVDVRDCTELKAEIEKDALARGSKAPEIHTWKLDMMAYDGCRELFKRARALGSIDHVLMTMGILAFKRRESPEGWETSIQVNYLSNALIALLLLPLLKSSSSNPSPPVITFITSFGLFPASPTMSMPKTGSYMRKLSNNKDGMAQAHQYGRSKGLLLYFARELADRLSSLEARGGPKITVNSADPGTAWTGLTAPNQSQLIPRLITNFGARDPLICATALVNGVSAGPEGHGKIMMDFKTAAYPGFMNRASGKAKQLRIWEETRKEFESKVPEIETIYSLLDSN